jgi:hypothetical protein
VSKLVQRDSGLVVVESDRKAEPPPEPPKRREYRVVHYGGLGTVQKFLKHLHERGGELVSIARHGSAGSGICLSDDRRGYVVTYFHHESCDVGEPT